MIRIAMLLSNPFVHDPRVHEEALALSESGYDVTVVAWDRECKYPQRSELHGIHIRRVRVQATFGQGIKQLLPFLSFWRQAIAMLSREEMNVIHCHDLDTAIAGWILARRQGAKLVYDAHECYPAMFSSHGNTAMPSQLLEWFERLLSRRVDLIITIGQSLRMRFESMTDRPVAVVGNWKDPDDYAYDPAETAELADKLKVNGRLVISFIGQFNNDRVIVPLVKAVRHSTDILLIVAGRGEQQAEIARLANDTDNVRFLGVLPMHDTNRYVALSDVIYYGLNPAYPNNRYSAPNALFSALAAGKAVLTTGIGEIAQIVAAERCGVVLESLETEAVLAALHLLRDPQMLVNYKRNAAHAGEVRYNRANARRILLESYAQLLAQGPEG